MEGEISASPSKSFSHRAFALALMAQTPSFLINPLTLGDVGTTITFCEKFGARVEEIQWKEEVKSGHFNSLSSPLSSLHNLNVDQTERLLKFTPPKDFFAPQEAINAKNSGTSIRIMTALATLFKGETRITGDFFNRNRPIDPLIDALTQIGVEIEYLKSKGTKKNMKGLKIIGDRKSFPGKIQIPGDISSQFITALMFLAPNLKGNKEQNKEKQIKPLNATHIILTTPAKSYPYLKISENILSDFNIEFSSQFGKDLKGSYTIPSNQSYSGKVYRIPGDFSSMAFPLVAGSIIKSKNDGGSEKPVIIKNLDFHSPQGDKEIVSILKKCGANIDVKQEQKKIVIRRSNKLVAFSHDCSQTPDLFPILSVLALFCEGTSTIYNAKHVRIKETDRIAVMARELEKMGADLEERADGIVITGPQKLNACEIKHDRDHRIAMAMVVASMFAEGCSLLMNPEVVKDSYPRFFEDLEKLGLEIR